MEKISTVNNYLVFHNGTIENQICNEDILINGNNVVVNHATSLQIIYLIDQDGEYQFNLELNGKLELIEFYDIKAASTLNKKIDVARNAEILRYSDNQSMENCKANLLEEINVARNAHVKVAYVELSNSDIEMNIDYKLQENDANVALRLASLAKKTEKKHLTLSITHLAPYTIGIMDNYGVVKDNASLVIDGIGTIKKGNHQSNSHQANKIIVFDEKCNAKANPYLYIDEYDVKASHGASVGKIDENHLYYLQSRGLSRDASLHLVTYGYFIPVLEYIENDELKEKFNQILKEKVAF
ncbi:MAG: SufD family Fe-S cluster assembly protein [Thomasclavelia sp.]